MSDAVDVYGLHSSTGYWVQRLARSMNEYFERQLAQHANLGALGREGASTPSEVACVTGVAPFAVTRPLDRLQKRGLLQRVRSATDPRSVLLQLTEQKLAAFRDTIKKMLRNADGPIEQL